MSRHDHVLVFTGIWEGYPSFDLECEHPDDHFHTDDEGEHHSDCLVQSWWSHEGTALIQASGSRTDTARFDNQHSLKLWTHWDIWGDTPMMLGIREHEHELELKYVRKSDTQHVWSEAGEEEES